MKKNNPVFLLLLLMTFTVNRIEAQGKLSIENVRSVYVRNSGTIMSANEVKGYFTFYESDKIDKNTNEYTVQITDENLNKIKDIKFEGNKKLRLLESSYNGSSIMFLFSLPSKPYDRYSRVFSLLS